ncbi:MAG: PAS domain-containing protein [Actinomycetota bacterium]|nr:PAS domain-containing protein [Actinomycetota bacterium]
MSTESTSRAAHGHTQLLHAQALIDHSKSVVFVKGCDGRHLVVNQAFRHALAHVESDPLGKTDDALFSPDEAARLRHHDEIVLKGGDSIEFEEEVDFGTTVRTYATVKFPILDDSGTIVGSGGVATDITDYKDQAVTVLIDGKIVVLDHNPESHTRARAEHQASVQTAMTALARAALTGAG